MRLKQVYEFVDLDGESIAVPVDNTTEQRKVIRINETGKAILALLVDDITEDQLVDEITHQYNGDKAFIKTAVLDFVAKLRENNLVS